MGIIVPQPPDMQAEDPEEFCPDCLAGMESSEHHYECVAPLDQLEPWSCCGHLGEMHGPEVPGCIECRCLEAGPPEGED